MRHHIASLGTALFLFAASCGTAQAYGPGKINDFDGRRVLLIGIDGTRADALRKVVEDGRAPALAGLIKDGSVTWNGYTGGEPGSATPQKTLSGPGWSTIFTGVWRDKHGVTDNRFVQHHLAQWPHLARHLKDTHPFAWTASLCDWPEISKFIVESGRGEWHQIVDFDFVATPEPMAKGGDYAQRDTEVAIRSVEHLRRSDPDFMFVYFGDVDEVGHGSVDPGAAFSPESEPYLSAISAVDRHIAEVLAAVRARPQIAQESWLILVTTDHGGRKQGHGGQSPEERTIWMIAAGGSAPAGQVIAGPVPQTAIAPTVFAHLGVPVAPEWGWEAAPFAIVPPQPAHP